MASKFNKISNEAKTQDAKSLQAGADRPSQVPESTRNDLDAGAAGSSSPSSSNAPPLDAREVAAAMKYKLLSSFKRDTRTNLVKFYAKKLTEAEYLTSEPLEYAIKIDHQIFQIANNRYEYQLLWAARIHEVQVELEEKQRKKKESHEVIEIENMIHQRTCRKIEHRKCPKAAVLKESAPENEVRPEEPELKSDEGNCSVLVDEIENVKDDQATKNAIIKRNNFKAKENARVRSIYLESNGFANKNGKTIGDGGQKSSSASKTPSFGLRNANESLFTANTITSQFYDNSYPVNPFTTSSSFLPPDSPFSPHCNSPYSSYSNNNNTFKLAPGWGRM